jgi:uncharacterized membrane protein
MTFQVSDKDLTDHRFRTTALVHALLSHLFGVVISPRRSTWSRG